MKIQAIIGLGNPGPSYYYHRHSIGFRVLDSLAKAYDASWKPRDIMEIAEIMVNGKKVLLIKPQTYMNTSGAVVPFLSKQGIKADSILVVHDELEIPFGKVVFKIGGSARGHNGLRSIIQACGENFARIRCGVGRPDTKEEVPQYVLQNFKEDEALVDQLIENAVQAIENNFKEA